MVVHKLHLIYCNKTSQTMKQTKINRLLNNDVNCCVYSLAQNKIIQGFGQNSSTELVRKLSSSRQQSINDNEQITVARPILFKIKDAIVNSIHCNKISKTKK